MIVKSKYDFGDIVYIKNDPEQDEYFVTGVVGRPSGIVLLKLDFCGTEFEIYEFEVSKEINRLKIMGVNKEDED